ncbi:MAG: hypothetical protein ACPF9Q_03830 [Opitutales bacterium]
MLKKIFFFLLGLFALCLIGLFFFGSVILNKSVTTTINAVGPKVTQTPVSVEAVDLSLTSGSGTITGLKVGNPEGYKSENIFELGEIEVDVKPTSLTSDTIVVEKVHINGPKISYEKTLKGSNLKDLQNNIKAFIQSLPGAGEEKIEGTPSDPASDKPAPKVIIEDFQIKGGTIYAGLMGVGIEVPLPSLSFENIGADDGPSFAEIGDQIFQEILNVVGPALQNSTEFLGDSGKAVIDTTQEEVIDRAAKELLKLFGQ